MLTNSGRPERRTIYKMHICAMSVCCVEQISDHKLVVLIYLDRQFGGNENCGWKSMVKSEQNAEITFSIYAKPLRIRSIFMQCNFAYFQTRDIKLHEWHWEYPHRNTSYATIRFSEIIFTDIYAYVCHRMIELKPSPIHRGIRVYFCKNARETHVLLHKKMSHLLRNIG